MSPSSDPKDHGGPRSMRGVWEGLLSIQARYAGKDGSVTMSSPEPSLEAVEPEPVFLSIHADRDTALANYHHAREVWVRAVQLVSDASALFRKADAERVSAARLLEEASERLDVEVQKLKVESRKQAQAEAGALTGRNRPRRRGK